MTHQYQVSNVCDIRSDLEDAIRAKLCLFRESHTHHASFLSELNSLRSELEALKAIA
jgi:hypothetical protein